MDDTTWMTAETFTAIGTWALAAFTFWLVRGQINESKRSTGLQLFVQLTRDFQDPNIRKLRRAFAAALAFHRERPDSALNDVDLLQDETVLEFFENLANLTREGILDKQVVWNYFSVAIEGYWYAVRDLIAGMRNNQVDDDLYRDIEWLADELAKITAKRRGGSQPSHPSLVKISNYLRSEMSLI